MTPDIFADRLREGVVVLDGDRLGAARGAVGELAKERTTATEALGLVRLAFALPTALFERPDLLEALGRAGLPSGARYEHLTAVAACLVLIDRFGRPLQRRTAKTLAPDAAAAAAIEALTGTGGVPAHPDLVDEARRWRTAAAEHVRHSLRTPEPPGHRSRG